MKKIHNSICEYLNEKVSLLAQNCQLKSKVISTGTVLNILHPAIIVENKKNSYEKFDKNQFFPIILF